MCVNQFIEEKERKSERGSRVSDEKCFIMIIDHFFDSSEASKKRKRKKNKMTIFSGTFFWFSLAKKI